MELLCKKVACHATKLAIIKRVRKRRRESTVHNTQLEGQGTPRLLCLGLARRLRRSGATLVNTLCITVVWPLQEGGGGEVESECAERGCNENEWGGRAGGCADGTRLHT